MRRSGWCSGSPPAPEPRRKRERPGTPDLIRPRRAGGRVAAARGGLATAKYLLLTSRTIGADEALRLGLVNRVSPAAATQEAALELATEVAAHPPEAVARLKRMLHDWDGVEGRARAEGESQVEWQRSGPGLPYSD